MEDLILIGDSGSTKTEWTLIRNEKLIYTFHTIGLNPFFVDSNTISKELLHSLKTFDFSNSSIKKCFFYGAGCNSVEKNEIIKIGISSVFNNCEIEVESDLMGAARSLFGSEKGLIGILGTGSNAALYNGSCFSQKAFSLGFILGDEGSGGNIGKTLIVDFIRKKMPAQLLIDFHKSYALTLDDVLAKVYKHEFPNRYLASYATFASKHQNHEYIKAILEKSFSKYIEEQILNLDFDRSLPVGLIGSIAFYFKDIITRTFLNYNLNLQKIEKSPMRGLVNYHNTSKL